MKRLLILLTLMATATCGTLARERVLMPAMLVALDRVIAPAVRSGVEGETDTLDAEVLLGEMKEALGSGDRNRADEIRELWSSLEPWAQAGVDARVANGELTEGTAGSKRETFRQFGLRAAQL
jgi:hypothetical protein